MGFLQVCYKCLLFLMNYEHWCLQFQPASNLELNLFFLLRDVIELIQLHKQFQIIQFLYANLQFRSNAISRCKISIGALTDTIL